jgi:dTDP-4-amino-4,6-dideoxygalactose transaminase
MHRTIFGGGEKMKKIPFNKVFQNEKIHQKIFQHLSSMNHFSGNGPFSKKVQELIKTKFKTKEALLTPSCTAALELAAILLNLKEGDEVILPSYTFVSTANPILLRGATPVFADIDERTLNIDPEEIAKKITPRTKAIFPVHYAGVSCDMDSIMSIAKSYNLIVVEDAAQGVNAKYKGHYLGTIGDIGCYSFHETKNYSCGEGGAILINKDEQLAKRAEIIREKGTNRSQFFRGEVDKYTWVDIGSSYLLSEILAAVLLEQFEHLHEINEMRRNVFNRYYEQLLPLEKEGYLRLPIIPKECETNYHIFYILLPSEKERNRVMDELKQRGIMATFHYVPLHLSTMGQKLGYKKGDLPKTEDLSSRLLRLPMYAQLLEEEIDFIVESLYDIVKQK